MKECNQCEKTEHICKIKDTEDPEQNCTVTEVICRGCGEFGEIRFYPNGVSYVGLFDTGFDDFEYPSNMGDNA